MFTIEEIESAHAKVTSGADFPKYIKSIGSLGVDAYETWVGDNHNEYMGEGNYRVKSNAKYEELQIASNANVEKFKKYLKDHQDGKTDYYQFCLHCAETGIEKWRVSIENCTCTYFDKAGQAVLTEKIPG